MVRPHSADQRGFSLIEISIVLVIIGLLLALSAEFAGNYLEKQRYANASSKLSAIEKAMVRFVAVTGRLPCPDTNADGVSDGSPGSCPNITGFDSALGLGTVPYETLGIARDIATDPQGTLFAYAVLEDLTDTGSPPSTPAPFTITQPAQLQNEGFEVQVDNATVQDPTLDPSAGELPTGAAYILMAELWYDDPATNGEDGLGDAIDATTNDIDLAPSYISELVRRPTVAEVAREAERMNFSS
ncbi:hypothetical protein C882_3309 [Caenispirillum salinarum AK4]|uniref:Prepilin-type N-terminal cleavage/methylation domain-containing protein n=1 Tax=Caenispirillum salinarum AK4 TaxID=1238182 RepID=K9H1W7_9PROT|nr:prepilin-type N-terminal cleavage/methylation domain-containing protein [Caenispirillum salinarum]EKV32245.1 hypothetical protein C882_3309 [Caenispirillum salinarum AK4]